MLIVKKFGGSSVADKERIFNVAKRCIEDYQAGHDVVVVLSAMGKTTDHLLAQAKEINPRASKREVDMQQLGVKAIVMHNTHPREAWLSKTGAESAVRMLESGEWNYRDIPTMVYPMNQFDRAQEEMETKYGSFMKSVINMEMEDGEPYMAK